MRTSLPWHDAGAAAGPRGLRLPDRWSLLALALALAVALPVLVVLASLLVPAGEIWRHLAETVLSDYCRNTLAAGVGRRARRDRDRRRHGLARQHVQLPRPPPVRMGAAAAVRGAGLHHRLHLHRPPAVRRAGADALRDAIGWGRADYWFPQIRSLGGAVVVHDARALSLRLSAGARRVPRAVGLRARGQPHARRAAPGAASSRSRCRWRGRRSPAASRSR